VARRLGASVAGAGFPRAGHDEQWLRGVAEAAAGRLVLTAGAEKFLHDRPDLEDTIRRLQGFQEAGADVLYAPGLSSREDIAAVIEAVDRPLNVLLRRDGPTIPDLAALGAGRISLAERSPSPPSEPWPGQRRTSMGPGPTPSGTTRSRAESSSRGPRWTERRQAPSGS
jgi:hypothetical protein